MCNGPRIELCCAACGYGAIVRIAPESCPMCRGTVWEHAQPNEPPNDER